MIESYYSDSTVQLYHGKMEEVVQELTDYADVVVADPPYGETSHAWDRWVDGWPSMVATRTNSMWCFGSIRVFLGHQQEFVDWKLSQDVVWEKTKGSGFTSDRFKRVHEHVLHFYQGEWAAIYHRAVREPSRVPIVGQARNLRGTPKHHTGGSVVGKPWIDDGTRLVRSVIRRAGVRAGLHPTEKPMALLQLLIEYSVPPGGSVLDPFAGSGSTLLTARSLGRRAIGIEANEEYCEKAAKRLAEPDLFGGAA